MSGKWCTRGGEQAMEEHWLPPRGDMLLGVSRTLKGGETIGFEYLRIFLADVHVTYIAQPGGRPSTSFPRSSGGVNWVRFENPAHDFPQRIEYRRQGDTLRAEIAGPGEDGVQRVNLFEFVECAP